MSAQRLPQPRADLAELRAYGTQQEQAPVRLQSNEWATPTPLARYLEPSDLSRVLLNRYPDTGASDLKLRLGALWDVRPEEIVLGNGSNEVLLATFLVFGGAGRVALVFTPTYTMYARLARLAGTEVRAERVGLPYLLDAPRVRAALERHRPHVVCFCSPNNPTGNLVPEGAILAAAEAAPDALVLVDEAYADFAGVSMLPRLATYPNLAVSKTFSKARAAAGLRLGVLIARPDVAEHYEAARLPYNVNAITQVVAARIADDRAGVAARVAEVARESARVERELRAHGALEVFPSVTNFVLFRHRERPAAELHAALLARGVLVRDVSGWPDADECLRVTVGTTEENARFLAAVHATLATEGVRR